MKRKFAKEKANETNKEKRNKMKIHPLFIKKYLLGTIRKLSIWYKYNLM